MSRAGLRFLCVASASVVAAAVAASCGFPTVTFAPDSVSAGGGGGETVTTSSSSTSAPMSSSASSSSHSNTTSSHASGGGNGGNGGDASTSSSGGAMGTGGAGGGCCDCDGDGHQSIACGGDDCADHDARAHPGQSMFFSSPIMGPTSPGTEEYDFNCDGSQTFKSGTQVSCASQSSLACNTNVLWVNAPPACGMSGATGHCIPSGLKCAVQMDGDAVQACN